MKGALSLYIDLLDELNRLQESFEHAFRLDGAGRIRALPRSPFAVINVGSTARSMRLKCWRWRPVPPQYRPGFTLSRELDPGKIEAKRTNGVLNLRSPKAEHARPRRIEFSVG